MKKLVLTAVAAFLFTPFVARPMLADDGSDDGSNDSGNHHRMSASEMAVAGFAAAAILGASGYLILRRRRAA